MLCSARELKLSEDHGGLLELAADAVVGQDIRLHLNLDDTLFTLKLTPNLAHCLSVYGVAREVAALTGAPLKSPSFPAVAATIGDKLPVKVNAPDLCGRFSGRIVRGVNTRAATPQWMVDRLARCGQRSVTALVDISNYVMFEYGRPSHIFDLDKIHGALDVRWGNPGQQLKLLNGNTVTVDEKVGVIADDVQVESLAGIMGGDATAVSDDTRNVYVEAAFWWPKAIAGRSRRFNFSTDAGHRFERGVDPAQTVEHIERITQLILDICGDQATQCGPMDDLQVNVPRPEAVRLRVARASKVIGMPLTQAQCADALRRLGLPVTEGDGVLTVSDTQLLFASLGYSANAAPRIEAATRKTHVDLDIDWNLGSLISDPEGDSLYVGIVGASHGTVRMAGDGRTLYFKPDTGFVGDATVTLIADTEAVEIRRPVVTGKRVRL